LDERSHGSLRDAAQFLDCPILKFKHRDANDFAHALHRCGRGARIIVLTDGMFAHDGSIAPLHAFLKLLPRDGLLVVDDAHGGGTIGKTGKGAVEVEGISRARVVQNVTLSKALGVYGGAVLCSKELRARFVDRSRIFGGATPLPLPLTYAACRALDILKTDHRLRRRLERNADYVKQPLRNVGFVLPDNPGPIVGIQLEAPQQIARLKRALLAAKILPPFSSYSGNGANGWFRFALSSEHTQKQLDHLIQVLKPFAPGPAR
jgi:7-keto-8-aminopelargonate synthetase-like enzyme